MSSTADGTTTIRCHYEVLGIPQDADAKTIKKAHRKKALLYHPDKSQGMEQEFLLVQQAYECLSDTQERSWYDDHREAILKGWTGSGTDNNVHPDDMVFNVVPYQHPSCYQGYSDSHPQSFFQIYQHVFTEIIQNEMSSSSWDLNFPSHFGNSTTPWTTVSQFYACWESFGSTLNYAWVDTYDVMEAPNRRIRRAMEDENKKVRKQARKQRNDDIAALVHFVKRRDPRVKHHQEEQRKLQQEKEREAQTKKAAKKLQTQQQREEWKIQAERDMQQFEEQDRLAGRVRLADLEDDDYDYGGGKKKRGKKGKKKNKKRQQQQLEQQEKEEAERLQQQEQEQQENNGDDENDVATNEAPLGGSDKDDNGRGESDHDIVVEEGNSDNDNDVAKDGIQQQEGDDEQHDATTTSHDEADVATLLEEEEGMMEEEYEEYESSSSESEEEPDVWRCEVCRKDFKSQGQMENHMKSKKHKEKYKKYQAKLAKQAKEVNNDDIMEDMLNDMAL